ncbi:MAG: TetR family transcriptional regulator C-terminal domain-containing protein [Acidobacteriota bacterium]|nr:MAG: TetR family transcriptional regulator C-terminal domain-containing protein [Acidobacteriota bacterium]
MAARQFVQDYEEQRREELIVATYLEVAEKGYSAVTLQDIARRAGVSKGSTLYYFATKEDLFLGALEWMVERVHARIREAAAAGSDPVGKIRNVIDAIFRNAQESRQFFLAYSDFVSLGARNARFHDLNARFYAGCCGTDRMIIEEGIAAGVFRQVDPDDASSMVRALIDGLMMQWFFSSEGTFDDYRQRCQRIILQYLAIDQGIGQES